MGMTSESKVVSYATLSSSLDQTGLVRGAAMFDFIVAQGPGESTIYLGGEIDFAAALELTPRIEDLADDSGDCLHIDLSGVTFLDSEGLKMLLRVFDAARRIGLEPSISAASSQAKRVMEMAGVADVLLSDCSVCDSPACQIPTDTGPRYRE